jgi:flavorubredoxin
MSARNYALTEIFTAGAIIVGSPTMTVGLRPSITPILEEIRGLRFKNKVGATFCSYGWTGEAAGIHDDRLKGAGIRIVADAVSAKWQPGPEELAACEQLGRTVSGVLTA